MNIDITRLKNGLEEYTNIDLTYSFTKEQLKSTDIMQLDDISVKGKLAMNFDNFYIDVTVMGTMILPCAVTLKPVAYPFSIVIQEEMDEELQESLKKVQNTIDIFPIIWENILMEIPLRVVSEDVSDAITEGDGWKLITEKEESTNPALEQLKDLL